MRFLLALLYDVVALVLALLCAPFRLARRRRPAWLALEITGDPPWRAAPRRFAGFARSRREPLAVASLYAFSKKLEEAAGDRFIRGVIVKVEGFHGPGAKLEAVRHALARFREQGKEVVVYGRAVSMREYAAMAGGSQVFLAPGGRIDLKGYCSELFVVGETLSRIGIRAQFLRRAEHKTAPEMFTDREVSPAQRETTEAILDELSVSAATAIAEGRSRSLDTVRGWIDEGPFGARRALERGLIDAIEDGEGIEQRLAEKGEEKARQVPIMAYRKPSVLGASRLKRLRRGPRIARLPVEGILKLGESVHLPWAPRAAGSDTVVKALRRAREDRSIRAVVLAIDSRGGSSLASELVLRAVRRTAEKKPVVAFFDRVAASGGYMAAVGASAIVAAPHALTGSIGVFGGKLEISGLLDRLGVGRAVLKRGANASLESSFVPWTEGERAVLDREIEETYRDFLAIVAEGRKRPVEEIEPLAGGRVYTGRRARELGLVDELGGFEEAVAKAASLAGIAETPEVIAIEPPTRGLAGLARAWRSSEALRLLAFLAQERVFAFDKAWVLRRL